MAKRGLRKDWQQQLDNPKIGTLKIWWIPQIPMKPFEVPVKNLSHARYLLETLAEYDFFQLENRVKPDYSNAGGLCIFEGEWVDWEDPATGEGIDELSNERIKELDSVRAALEGRELS